MQGWVNLVDPISLEKGQWLHALATYRRHGNTPSWRMQPLKRMWHFSFMRICNCYIFRLLPHFRTFQRTAHMWYFSCINWHFRQQFEYYLWFYCRSLLCLGFVTSTIWLPTEWHHPWVRTPVERDYYTVIHNYGNPYEKWNIFFARPHLWLQLGMVKPEIMLCETVLNLSTSNTLTYLRTY